MVRRPVSVSPEASGLGAFSACVVLLVGLSASSRGGPMSAMTQAEIDRHDAQWQAERDRLAAALALGKDAAGWPLSPEAKDGLRADIRECDRILARRAA